jgi:hypothetical protein
MKIKRYILRRKGVIIGLLTLMLCSMAVVVALPNPDISGSDVPNVSSLNPYIYGTCRLFFTRGLYWGIENVGEVTAEEVSGSFLVTGGFGESISFADSYTFESIEPGFVSGRYWTQPIKGFGPLTLSLDVTASNVAPLSISVPGFQIGFRTLVFFAPWKGSLF